MATAEETLQATLSETEYGALVVLAQSTTPPSGRKIAAALGVSPTTANSALSTLSEAGFATSKKSGRATLWRLAVSNPSISTWLAEVMPGGETASIGSSPYATAGGGVRLEHTYAACLIAGFLAGEALSELGDAFLVDSIGLQASNESDVDDLLIKGHDTHGETYRASIAVRRSPALTTSDDASVPLFRDFLATVTDHWSEVSAGRWQLVLAVSSNANAITQLAELAELAHSLPSGNELANRMMQAGRTNAGIRGRYEHIQGLVERASKDLASADGLSAAELTWRLLSSLRIRSLRLERTDRADRTSAVNTLQRVLANATPATADALFSRIEELVGEWAPQAAVLTQSVVRRSLGSYRLTRSTSFATAWSVFDRLGSRLRDSIRPALRSGSESLELERPAERTRLLEALRSAGISGGALVVTGDPDVGKSALSLRAIEALKIEDAAVLSLSLRDLLHSPMELESQLGGSSVDDVLASGEVRPIRLLLVDGGESVLEGKGPMLRTVAAAALRAGFGVVAVTRTDGSRQVREELARASELAGSGLTPGEYIVGPLAEDERLVLSSTFAVLARLGSDPRAAWLLGRPGLVDVLLRTGTAFDPTSLLCEADVFSTVWQSLIRRNEVHIPGSASPDDREQAALDVARRTLHLAADSPRGTGAAELRSDGVLRAPNNPALSQGDEFATDLFRDFAICRLFVTHQWEPLAHAEAPRWAIRAARLGCQAALLGPSRPRAWADLSTKFSEIATAQGDRWLEVPYEALLTLGDAESAIRELWGTLAEDKFAGLMTLLRLAEARYVSGTIGDAFALAPLVKVIFCEQPTIEHGPRFGHRTVPQIIRDIVLAWLRGMTVSHAHPDPLRQEVRDVILGGDGPLYDGFAIEALATLGEDTDDRAEAWLREVAKERPGNLNPAVESFAVGISMSRARPRLLLDLAEAYYIELSDPDRWSGGRSFDDGIRDFQHGLGVGAPGAAWYYGPFFRLLNTIPLDAIAFINRMLNHAAKFRVQRHSDFRSTAVDDDEAEGITLRISDAGERRYVGDSHVWAWYRGSSVGPYACMSALLALERFADNLLEGAKIPARTIVDLLVRECHNLAVPGLIVGFLTRHQDDADDLLDPFLASPDVWHLETSRVVGEHFHVRDPDADKLTGGDRRRHTPHQTVGAMVVNARVRGDERRLEQLAEIGAQLVENAREHLTGAPGDAEYIAMIEGWASQFRFNNYRATSTADGVLIEFERPTEIEQILAPGNRELQKVNTLYGLQNRYGLYNDTPEKWPIGLLDEDLSTARQLDGDETVLQRSYGPEDPLVAVAAAGVRAYALGLVTLDPANLTWAAEAIIWAAENPQIDEFAFSGSMFSLGADRSAAASAPLLLLAQFDHLGLDRVRVENCLRSLTTSVFDEVRAIYVEGCELVWAAPCDVDLEDGECRRHQPAWRAAIEGLIDCRLGPWNQEMQRREPDPLPSSIPFSTSLHDIADADLLVNRLRKPVACMVDARHVPCVESSVGELWAPLWDAHRRGLAHWWKEGYDNQAHITHEPTAQRMVEIALDGDRDIVRSHIETFSADSNALHLLFDGFATVFTYDGNLRQFMADFWPWAMEIALDTVGDGAELRRQRHWFDYMAAALLPTPNARSSDDDIDGTFATCREDWLQPETLGGLADRWLHLARWEPKAVDAVIKFAKGAPLDWQTSVALTWIETIIGERFDLIANHLWYLEEWLTGLRNGGAVVGDVKSQYHRIVDGLAASGDRGAVQLQQLDE